MNDIKIRLYILSGQMNELLAAENHLAVMANQERERLTARKAEVQTLINAAEKALQELHKAEKEAQELEQAAPPLSEAQQAYADRDCVECET